MGRYYISKGAIVDQLGGDLNSTPLHWATRYPSVALFFLSIYQSIGHFGNNQISGSEGFCFLPPPFNSHAHHNHMLPLP